MFEEVEEGGGGGGGACGGVGRHGGGVVGVRARTGSGGAERSGCQRGGSRRARASLEWHASVH
eukprot:5194259-Prymnesium_polylepis.1